MSYTEVLGLLDTTFAGWSFATTTEVTSVLTNILEDYISYGTTFHTDTQNGDGGTEELKIYGAIFYGNDDLYTTYYNYGYNKKGARSESHHSLTYTNEATGIWLSRESEYISLSEDDGTSSATSNNE